MDLYCRKLHGAVLHSGTCNLPKESCISRTRMPLCRIGCLAVRFLPDCVRLAGEALPLRWQGFHLNAVGAGAYPPTASQ